MATRARMTAPTVNPSQKLRDDLFPPWRLKYGIKNASDDELEASSEACETWAWRSGGLLMAGLLIELAIACIHPTYDSFWERYGGVIATAFVVVGVGAELRFGRMGKIRDDELRLRSNEEVMEASERARLAEHGAGLANERAELARLETEKLRAAHAWRELTRDQIAALKGELKIA